ncbi:uracil-DNA glycosylase family protein, partial [Comamonas sp.]|uniref:uracil-DNA glycosylase family protein n=1 Tax=Comamonas sp. TaxID=34028 RepID=UPI002FC9368B
ASAPWFMAPLVHAYAESATGDTDATPDAGWLVLVECADPADPWAGDAGALLNNMLRALRLQLHPQVRIAPLTRQAPDAAAGDSPLEPLAPALQAAITAHQPARVLVLGLHAARAVLQRTEALGPLRAELHQLHGVPTVVSYDPAYLLRAPHAKPGAWADLCRAHALQPPAP